MNILVTPVFERDLRRHFKNASDYRKLRRLVEQIAEAGLQDHPRVRRLRGTEEAIYVLPYGRFRVMLTAKDQNLLLLGIAEH